MSSFQALTTAIAAQVGTGNIVGASGAILTGGPGAIFWMWIIAFFGMATVYAEAVLAQKTRIVEKDGNVLGRHKGIHCYTLGQRRGLGIPAEHRLFVSEILPETNQVLLSDGGDLYTDFVWGVEPNWIGAEPPQGPMECQVRLRHSKTAAPATVIVNERGEVEITLLTPGRAPTPGQMAVFYDGDRVLGSAWIEGKR